MSLSIQTKTLLNGTISAFKEILPNQVTVQAPKPFNLPHAHLNYCVLVGMVGDVKARIIIDADQSLFAKLCQSLYGFELDGDLLESFVGEFGNMVAGKLCSFSATDNIQLDITTPTVMIGETQIPMIQHTFSLPISIATIGDVNLLLTIES
ncbi:MAG: chemotaxis protein CheX [Kurthia sp.]|nr:chemotaxis protein CheX [Candidatus Kurthia equi]